MKLGVGLFGVNASEYILLESKDNRVECVRLLFALPVPASVGKHVPKRYLFSNEHSVLCIETRVLTVLYDTVLQNVV